MEASTVDRKMEMYVEHSPGPRQFVSPKFQRPTPDVDGFAGKGSQKLSDYYERLGANYLGRIENQTFSQRKKLEPPRPPHPYGTDKKYQASPEYSRFNVDDIEGARPNAFGKVASIKGKDYMKIEDIPGARPRYVEDEERR